MGKFKDFINQYKRDLPFVAVNILVATVGFLGLLILPDVGLTIGCGVLLLVYWVLAWFLRNNP